MRINNWFLNLIDKIFFTESCLCCFKNGPVLCEDCLSALPRPERDLPEYVTALYEYRNNVVKKILTDAKYRKRFAGLKIFGRVMADSITDLVSEYNELNNYSRILIIPVPISNKRYKMRGFNQSEILAKEIMNNLKEPMYEINTDIVKKIKDKTPQASIKNRKDRLISPVGTFEVKNYKLLKNTLCVIVDDITTTGGTIKELRRILIESGAVNAIGITVAH